MYMNANEFLARYTAGGRNFSGVKLANADLSAKTLNGADFSGADLSEAYLYKADLSKTNLNNALLPNANLAGAILIGACLDGAILGNADLSGANLSAASLRTAELYEVFLLPYLGKSTDLRYADLSGADLSYAKLDQALLYKATLREADFYQATLYNADLKEADLTGADLSYANLSRAILLEANLSKAILHKTNLDNADLHKAVMPDTSAEALATTNDEEAHNQAVGAELVKIWKNLRFRSEDEVKIAQALERAGVLFFPNCKGRLTTSENRQNREPDFLVCHQGNWGILEVDGSQHDAEKDAERDSFFKVHGISIIERYTAKQCREHADNVVQEFLKILSRE